MSAQAKTVTPEVSPAESFMSIPGQPYPSLFPPASPPGVGTVNPLDMLTPSSSYDEAQLSPSSPTPEMELRDSSPTDDVRDLKVEEVDDKSKQKKPTKKRKSWGQVLPEPKTNLPPRKRAKTEDEKEQRRVERVLRNRRAAQSSRERKRQEVENLEKLNKDLKTKVDNYEKTQSVLLDEIRRLRQQIGSNADISHSQSILDDASVTLSQKLFELAPEAQSAPAPPAAQSATSTLGEMFPIAKPATVNPATISPQLAPIPEEPEPTYPAHQSELSQLAQVQAHNQAESKDATLFERPATTSPDLAHPAVSRIGGGGPSVTVPSVANLDSASLGLAAATPHDAAYSLGESYGQFPSARDSTFVSEHMPIDDISNFINFDNLASDMPCSNGADGFGQSDFPLFDTYLDEDTSFFDNAAASADIAASNVVDMGFTLIEN